MSKLTGAATRVGVVPILTGQLAQLPLVNVRDDVGRKEALGHIPQQADRAGTFALDAQLSSIIALGLIVTRFRIRALSRRPIARRTPGTLRFFLTGYIGKAGDKLAGIVITAWSLRWAALRSGPSRTPLGRSVQPQVHLADDPRVAALVGTFLVVEPAIAFLADFNDLIAAECSLRRLEAVSLLAVLDRIQHVRDVPYGTGGKFTIVRTIAAGGTGEHDEVSVDASWAALGGIVVR